MDGNLEKSLRSGMRDFAACAIVSPHVDTAKNLIGQIKASLGGGLQKALLPIRKGKHLII
jgi:hypothetical protein